MKEPKILLPESLVDSLAENLRLQYDLTKTMATNIAKSAALGLLRNIAASDKTTIRGFGVFEYRTYKPRKFSDPRNQREIVTGERRKLRFRSAMK